MTIDADGGKGLEEVSSKPVPEPYTKPDLIVLEGKSANRSEKFVVKAVTL